MGVWSPQSDRRLPQAHRWGLPLGGGCGSLSLFAEESLWSGASELRAHHPWPLREVPCRPWAGAPSWRERVGGSTLQVEGTVPATRAAGPAGHPVSQQAGGVGEQGSASSFFLEESPVLSVPAGHAEIGNSLPPMCLRDPSNCCSDPVSEGGCAVPLRAGTQFLRSP